MAQKRTEGREKEIIMISQDDFEKAMSEVLKETLDEATNNGLSGMGAYIYTMSGQIFADKLMKYLFNIEDDEDFED